MDLHLYRNSEDRWRDLKEEARQRGAALATNAVTLGELAERLTPDLRAVSPGQRLASIHRAMRADDANGPSTTRYVSDAIRDLKGAGIPNAEIAPVAPTLSRTLERYNALLAKEKLVDIQDRYWAAAERAKAGDPWLRRFEQLIVHAIYDLSECEFALIHNVIEALPGGGTVLLFNATANVKPTQFAEWTWRRFVRDEALSDKMFPDFCRPDGPASDLLERLFTFSSSQSPIPNSDFPAKSPVRILEARGRYAEIEAIGGEIVDLLDRGADPSDIAVVARHIDAYGEIIEDVFSRYGIAHAFETGVPLVRVPFIKYWIALLDLATSVRGRDPLARVLASAYFEPRLSPSINVARILADIGYIDRNHLRASVLAARRSSPLTVELERFEGLLDRIETASALPSAFMRQLHPPANLTGRDLAAWRALAEEIEAIDPVVGETPFAEFRKIASEIAGILTVERFEGGDAIQGAPGIPRVRVISPSALGSREFRWVFAPGFADGEIPARSPTNPLLPDDAIEQLNRKVRPGRLLTSRDRNRLEPLYLFMTIDAATESATLSLPSSTLEGEAVFPSIYVGEILRHYEIPPVVHADIAPRPRESSECLRAIAKAWREERIEERHARLLLGDDVVRRAQWEKRGVNRADLGPGTLAIDNVWSPSALNALESCPFVFLARHRLRLRPVELPDFEIPAIEIGSLAHRILGQFYAEPIPPSDDTAAKRMDEIIQRVLAPVDIQGQGSGRAIDPSLWKIRRPQLVGALRAYVKFAVRDTLDGYETLPEYLDQPLPAGRFGNAMLAGRPDHLAVRRAGDGALTGIRIDDFKYSASSGALNQMLKESFQIPVYAWLAAKMLNADPGISIEGRYLLLRSPSSPVVAHPMDPVVFEEIGARIEGLVEKARAGRLHPEPTDPQGCAACEYRRLCRWYGG